MAMTEQEKLDKQFDDSFAEAIADPKPAVKEVVVDPAKPADKVVVEDKPADKVVVETKPADKVEPTPEEKAAAEAAAAAAAAAAETPEAKAAAETARIAAEAQAKIDEEAERKAAEPTPEQKKAAEDAAKAQQKVIDDIMAMVVPDLTDEEKAHIEAVRKDFPDIIKAMEIRQKTERASAEAMVKKMLLESMGQIYGDMEPIRVSVAENDKSRHWDAVFKKHPDFNEVLPGFRKWMGEQPDYLRKSLEVVYNGGKADEVIDVVQRYKDSPGYVPPKVGATPPAKDVVVADPNAVAALLPVNTQRQQIEGKTVDPNDYDGAFKEAAAAEEAAMQVAKK